mgnify:FL=1
MQAAWRSGYTAVPRGGDQAALVITPRGAQADRRGRLHLAHDDAGTLRWHWSDTGEPLQAPLSEPDQLLAEIDAQLTPGRAAR